MIKNKEKTERTQKNVSRETPQADGDKKKDCFT